MAAALNAANAHSPKGELSNSEYSYVLNDNDQLFHAKDYAPLIVAYHNGAPVRLSDVATVVDSQENIRNAGSVNGEHSVILQLYRQPQANIIDTVDRVLDAPAGAAGLDSAGNPDHGDPGSHHHHPRFGEGRRVHHGDLRACW